MILNADSLENKNVDPLIELYFRLRVKAVVALAKKFGKRRSEIVSLKMNDLRIDSEYLFVTFNLRKKHKCGFFQYLQFLQEEDPDSLDKPHNVLKLEWRDWTLTERGYDLKKDTRTKKVSVRDKYAKMIWKYRMFLRENFPDVNFLFPSGRMVFGEYYKIIGDKHLTGSHLLEIVKQLDPKCWLHLFRETKGSEIAKRLGHTLTAVYTVRDVLDLVKESTAFRYIRRYGIQEMESEIEVEDEEPEDNDS